MAVDFEAAFDTVSWEFLTEALHVYNFGPYYIEMIKILFLNPENFSRILLDGYLGSKIHMGRGIRQGDPVSGYLFNLVMEPLANQLLQSKTVKGISFNGVTQVRLSQYADDLILFTPAELNPIEASLRELEKFTATSGLNINVDKTKCLPIGNKIDLSFLNNLGVKVVNELKVLGIVYNNSNANIVHRNIMEALPNVKQEIAQWKRRHLTLIGKITVVKAMVISKIVHILSALPDPNSEDVKALNSIIFKFIWSDAPDKIKRKKLVQNYDRGGLRMIDLVSFIKSMKIAWVKRLYWAKPDVIWATHVKENLPDISELVRYGTTKLKYITKYKINNTFWRDVLNAWADFGSISRTTASQILTENVWFSNNTKFKKKYCKGMGPERFTVHCRLVR